MNAKNLKKMKLIDNIRKEPRASSTADISRRRVPLSDFPRFSEMESHPDMFAKYPDSPKEEVAGSKLKIKDLSQPQPEVTQKKTKKRKAEGSSHQTPKK